ncbi:MAG: hypothetical protein BWK80_13550 [Desulfobacteraceae bacterium IS3]|nr:MAG: hypothetical protein BWK80_13550 [Desulfobacteraceae bacterium IS3]
MTQFLNSDKEHSLPHPWNPIFQITTRFLAWGALFSILYILRSFFLLIFFTFVFAYIQTSGIAYLEKLIKNRTLRVIFVAAILLSILIAVGIFLVPKVKKQTEIFVGQFPNYIIRVDREIFELANKYPFLKEAIPELKKEELSPQTEVGKKLKNSPTASLFQQFLGFGEDTGAFKNVNQIIDTLGEISGRIAAITSAFLLSLLFSFLIVLDLPKLRKSVAEIEHTKLRFIYAEVADKIKNFSQVLGRALEAQFLIAIVNSILTAMGIYLLGLGENVAFLSVIVFLCSFIPVMGIFISSAPICLIALQTSGLQIMMLAIVLIIVIHLIEGYILNPRIYGSYMRINPVIVLIILTIGGKLFHFWGLLLGVPVCTYIFGYAIRLTHKTDETNKNP